jgi:hypothetical protein
MFSYFGAARSFAAAGALALMAAPLAWTPAAAEPGGQGWRALCVPGQEVEILVGSQWYRGIATGPDKFGDESCGVMTTAYTGREMNFAMASERMRRVQAPGVASPRVGPAPKPSETPREQQAWRALCQPGGEVDILVGGAWYKSIVVGPDEFGEDACSVSNTSYSGREMRFAMAPDRMRAVGGAPAAAATPTARQPGLRQPSPHRPSAAAPVTAPRSRAAGRPPLGRYVCRQYMTTIGYIQLGSGSYTVNGVRGGYSLEEGSGAIRWNGGAYAGWPARYEFSPGGGGHAHDEHIIRMTDEAGRLKIDCFLMAQ